MFFIFLLVFFLIVVYIFLYGICLLSLMVKLISEVFGVGIWKVMLWIFLFKVGMRCLIVLDVVVELGMRLNFVVVLFCYFFNEGLFKDFLVVVRECIVVIKVFVMLNFLWSIFMRGVM